MSNIVSIISHNLNINDYFDTSNICFFDIETTGLNRKYNMIYLIGLLYYDNSSNHWVLNQYFAEKKEDEKNILIQFLSDIKSFDILVTYNGNSFDLPFIESRLNIHSIDYVFDKSKSFDIYQIVRKNKNYLNLPDLKLKTIERSLGFIREDQFSGYDCIGFYNDYLFSRDLKLKEYVLQHNYDDLRHMLDIIKILDLINEKKSFCVLDNKFLIKDIRVKGDVFNIFLNSYFKLPFDLKYYESNYKIVSDSLNKILISMEFKRGFLNDGIECLYIDLVEFNLLKGLIDESGHSIKPEILPLIINKSYIIPNIINISKSLLMNILDGL